MIKEYVGSFEFRHQLTKYTLSNGTEIILSEDEMDELFNGSKLGTEIKRLRAENMKLAHQRDYYKSLIRNFSNILAEMKGV